MNVPTETAHLEPSHAEDASRARPTVGTGTPGHYRFTETSIGRAMTLSATQLDQNGWDALCSRAPSDMFYAVRTTGVFCRTDCASRRPRRDNVEFFLDSEDAIRAGYRACKRCRPTTEQPSPTVQAITRACRLMARQADAPTRAVAEAVGFSESYFRRAFKKCLGVTPGQYRRRILAEKARTELGAASTVTEAVYRAGYSSSSRFYDGIGRELGMKPSTANAGGRGETIRYASLRCSLGWVLVGWTDRGVCEVALDDHPDPLRAQLERHFPLATLEHVSRSEWASEVVRAIDRGDAVEVPLDIRGTAFQERVWQALREVPAGQTRTYAEVAAAIGAPNSARAVARACATNPLAVVVPCHRVVRKNGADSGYRWGLARKKALLERERKK